MAPLPIPSSPLPPQIIVEYNHENMEEDEDSGYETETMNERHQHLRLRRVYHEFNDHLFCSQLTPTIRVGRRIWGSWDTFVNIPSMFVSRKHFKINYGVGIYWIRDLFSVNGTYLNNRLIPGGVEVPLRDLDIISLAVRCDDADAEEDHVYIFQVEIFHSMDHN